MSSCAMRIVMLGMIIMSGIAMTTTSSDLMELDTVACIFFFPVKSDICEIVPYRKEGCIHEIRQEEFIEHEDDSERDDRILMTHDVAIIPRLAHDLLIRRTISEPREKIPDMEDIALLDHIDHDGAESKEEKCGNEDKNRCIESRMCRFADNQSPMKWEEYSENKYEIHGNTHEKYRKSERKKSALSGERWIPEKDDRKEDIDTKPNDRTKCCLEYLMQRDEVVEYQRREKSKNQKPRIERCHLECLCESIEERHEIIELLITINHMQQGAKSKGFYHFLFYFVIS